MFSLELQWKEFNVSLSDVKSWLEANVEVECLGLSANSKLEAHFVSELSQEQQDDVMSYWDGLGEMSDEAQNYMSAEDIEQERLAKVVSAKAKLALLGLTEEEINAILG